MVDSDGSGEIDYIEFAGTLKPDQDDEAHSPDDMAELELKDVACVHRGPQNNCDRPVYQTLRLAIYRSAIPRS
jgi:hypothetical protein